MRGLLPAKKITPVRPSLRGTGMTIPEWTLSPIAAAEKMKDSPPSMALLQLLLSSEPDSSISLKISISPLWKNRGGAEGFDIGIFAPPYSAFRKFRVYSRHFSTSSCTEDDSLPWPMIWLMVERCRLIFCISSSARLRSDISVRVMTSLLAGSLDAEMRTGMRFPALETIVDSKGGTNPLFVSAWKKETRPDSSFQNSVIGLPTRSSGRFPRVLDPLGLASSITSPSASFCARNIPVSERSNISRYRASFSFRSPESEEMTTAMATRM